MRNLADEAKKSSRGALVERALNTDSLIPADLKAGTGREVLGWLLHIPFDELSDLQVRFICVTSITSSPDSVQSFFSWVSGCMIAWSLLFPGILKMANICRITLARGVLEAAHIRPQSRTQTT